MSLYHPFIALFVAIVLHTILLSVLPTNFALEKVAHNKIESNMSLNFHYPLSPPKKYSLSLMNSSPSIKKMQRRDAERLLSEKPATNIPLPSQRKKSVEAFLPKLKTRATSKRKLISQNSEAINERKKIEPQEHKKKLRSKKVVPGPTMPLNKNRNESSKEPVNILNKSLSKFDQNESTSQSTNSETKQPTNEKNNTTQSESNYIEYVKRTLNRNKTYPPRAVRYREEGNVMITFQILKTGALTELRIKSSSGFPSLDRQAMQIVEKSSPFKRFPPNLSQNLLSIEVPMEFKLR